MPSGNDRQSTDPLTPVKHGVAPVEDTARAADGVVEAGLAGLNARLERALERAHQQRTHLVSYERTLEAREATATSRETALHAQTAELAAREQTLHEREQAVAARADELIQRENLLAQRDQEIAEQREHIKAQQREASAVAERSAALEQRAGQVAENERRLIRVAAQVKQQGAALDQRVQEVADRERAVAERETELNRRRDELEQRAAETERQSLAVAEAKRSAADRATRVARDEQALSARAAAVEAREAELAQQLLTLELREAEWRSQMAEQAAAPIATPDSSHDAPQTAAPVRRATPVYWSWRTAVIVMLAASSAAAAVSLLAPPATRSSLAISIDTESRRPSRALTEHAVMLEGAARAQPNPHLSDVGVLVDVDQRRLMLAATGLDPNATSAFLQRVAKSYVAEVNATAPTPQLPPAHDDLTLRRLAVQEEIERLAAEAAGLDSALAALPTVERRAELSSLVTALRSDREILAERITELRDVLAATRAQRVFGVVDDDDLAAALAEDPVYQQDQAEFAEAARQYQQHVGVAMLMWDEPLTALAAALTELRAVVREQHELQPPVGVAVVLEDVDAFAAEYQDVVTAAVSTLPEWRERLETIRADEEIVALVELHNELIDAVRRLTDEGTAFADAAAARAAGMLEQDEQGTRQVVVAALLRNEAQVLQSKVELAAAATRVINFADNVELDAANRQIRGLRGRLNRRSAFVRGQLQAAADAEAQQIHDEQLAAQRDELMAAEDEREQLVVDLADKLDELRALDVELSERRALEAERLVAQGAATRLKDQLEAIDAQLAELARAATLPDRAAIVTPTPRHERLGEDLRPQWAAVAASATASLVWLVIVGATAGRGAIARRPARVHHVAPEGVAGA